VGQRKHATTQGTQLVAVEELLVLLPPPPLPPPQSSDRYPLIALSLDPNTQNGEANKKEVIERNEGQILGE
jgi:hypothetical protein